MLYITTSSPQLLHYHLRETKKEYKIILTYTRNITDIKEALLQGVIFNNNGELTQICHLIHYSGNDILKELKQNKHNITYLIVKDINKWSFLINHKSIKSFNLDPIVYQYLIKPLRSVLTIDGFNTYWNSYCLQLFNNNPLKWYNEAVRILTLYKEKEKKLTSLDLDILYLNLGDNLEPYLKLMFTDKSKEIINRMSNKDLFNIFIGGEDKKSLLEKIKKDNERILILTSILKEAFYQNTIRLKEGIIIFDFYLKQSSIDISYVRKLCGL